MAERCGENQVDIGLQYCPQPITAERARVAVTTGAESPPFPGMHCCCIKKGGEEITLAFYKGWNLVSLPGQMSPMHVGTTCDTKNWRVFEYNKETGKFDPVKYPEIGKAYWVYVTQDCKVEARLEAPTLLDELEEITPGWNLIPVVPEMIGNKIEDLGDCGIKGVYAYDARARRWMRITGRPIRETLYGKGLAVKATKTCKLSPIEELPPIPPFPEEECAGEGEYIPVTPEALECCPGLTLIPPKEPNLVGIQGICTAKCGDGVCNPETESGYNCPKDCGELPHPLFGEVS